MKKRIISMLLVLITVLGMFPTAAFAAATEEEALGEVDIYNSGYELSYLSINGRIRTQIYTYYNYVNSKGQTKEIPAYCINPNTKGVPQSVPEGESIEYLAENITSDPKIMGIIANGYPHRGLSELKLENKYQAYYATKMALWCYLLPNWDIANLKVNPTLTGVEMERAQKILAAAKNIYQRGTAWSTVLAPKLTATPDRDEAYAITINGRQYKQQVFTVNSETWVCDYDIAVSFANPDEVPEGTRIVDMENNDITAITTTATGQGYSAKFKVLYPADAVAGKSGGVQLAFSADVYKYAIYYAVCVETDKYGTLQNYICDTDPTTPIRLSTYSYYGDEPIEEMETGLRIVKYQAGTTVPLGGALFEVINPSGDTLGTFVTNYNGEINIPLTITGNYTVIEREAPEFFLLGDDTAQNVTVKYVELFPGKTSTLVVENQIRPNLFVYKHDADTGEPIANTVFIVRAADGHSVDEIRTDETGRAELTNLLPGVYEITEKSVPSPYLLDAPSQLVTLYPNRDHTVYFENHKKPSLTVNKICSVTGDPLEGAKFQVIYASNNTGSGEINDLGYFYTDENGQFELTGLKDGWYKVTELESVPGYSIKEATQEVYIQSGTGKVLTFENIPLSALVVWKYDSVTGEAVEGAVFQVKYLTGTSGTGGTVIGTYKTSANGTFTVTGLREGTYIVEELASDSGHVIDTAPQTAYISGKDQDVVQLYFGQVETPYIYGNVAQGLSNGSSIVNVADVGGLYNGQWIMAASRWLTTVYAKTTVTLPKTGY